MRIFLLEDDELLSEIIEEFLVERGNFVELAQDGAQAEEILLREKFDLLLLDVQVPFFSGFEILHTQRMMGDCTPAIFITALNQTKDLKNGFEMGANDYIKKPFDLEELAVRIKNVTKHLQNNKMIILQYFIFDPKNFNLQNTKTKENFKLTQKENEILLFFIRNPNRLLSFQEITLNIWSYENIPSENTLRSYIKNLRRYLGFESISNIKGNGYRFNAI